MGATFSGPLKRPGPGSYWIKSSLSYANGNCVEVASLPGGTIGVRNSRDSAGPVLRFTSAKWHDFLAGVRNGDWPLPYSTMVPPGWRFSSAANPATSAGMTEVTLSGSDAP